MKKVICIVGPTSVGKTKLGVELAKRYHTDVISGDSVQVYKGLDIGSAKATVEEMDGIKHHLIDILEPTENFSVADFQKLVRDEIEKQTLPIIVGGTGLYISSVIFDYEFSEEGRDDSFAEKNKHLSNEELFEMLLKLDPEASKTLHANNRKRVERALEYFLTNGRSISTNNNKKTKIYDSLIICLNLDRELLYNRINQRVDKMVEDGLIEEVKALYDKGINSNAVTAIGYKELYEYFDGKVELAKAIDNIKLNTRHFAKRQFTWFRNQMNALFIDVDLDNFNNTIEEAVKNIDEFLKN